MGDRYGGGVGEGLPRPSEREAAGDGGGPTPIYGDGERGYLDGNGGGDGAMFQRGDGAVL